MTLSYLTEHPAGATNTFSCGNCGETFATKGEKRRHKLVCHPPVHLEAVDDPADLYSRFRNTPEIIARAAAEWDAMDENGRLPDGWQWPQNTAHARTLGEG
jgi:hypothetical protein